MATTTPNFGWSVPTSTDLVKDGATAIETLGDAIDASLVDLKGGTTGQVLKKATNTDMDFVWSADSAGMTNPMTTTGDTIYSSSGSTPARLGIGSTNQVLTVSGGVPSWTNGGMTLIRRVAFADVAGTGTSFDGVFNTTYETYLVVIERIYSNGSSTDDLQLQLRYAGPTTQTTGYYGNSWSAAYNVTTLTITSVNNASVFTLGTDIGAGNYPSSASMYFTRIGDEDARSAWWGNGTQGTGHNGTTVFSGMMDTVRTYTGFLLKSSSGTVTGEAAVYGLVKS